MSTNNVLPAINNGSFDSRNNVRQAYRDQWTDKQMSTPKIDANAISSFVTEANATTQGVDVSFSIVNATGMDSVTLLRATVMDISQAVVLQTWSASNASFTWSDTDKVLQSSAQAYYWLKLEPVNSSLNGSEVVVGPDYILLNPSLVPPPGATAISASHAAAANGLILLTINVSGIDQGDSIKIYASNYRGNPAAVAVGQNSSAPLQLMLQATGETITLEAIAVSAGGTEAASGPTCTLTLNATATAPAQVQDITVAQIATGNQVMWPSSIEAGVTSYQLYRGQRQDPFSSASLLATVAATSVGTVEYLDTVGLSGDWQYFVLTVSGSGTSPASAAATPPITYTSATLPTNVPTNATNNATVDSIDAGSSATIRIYGPGGVGTGYTRTTGFGTLTRPAGSITGMPYTTSYWVYYIPASQTFLATTSYIDTLPDGYEWVGTVKTVASGGSGGTSGGGGPSSGPSGCVEEGTFTICPVGTFAERLPNSDWIELDLGDGVLAMAPDTLVSVWKKASELTREDRVEVKGAGWRKPESIMVSRREGFKIRRTCPGGTYFAGPSLARLHNVKYDPLP